MFTEIINLIEERKLADAVAALRAIYESDDPKSAAYAGYLLGYINTRYDYDKKSKPEAQMQKNSSLVQFFCFYIFDNIEKSSEFPQPCKTIKVS